MPYLCYLEEMVNGVCAILEEVNDECGLCRDGELSLKCYFKELLLFKELLYIKPYFKEPQNQDYAYFQSIFLIIVSPPNSRC